MLITLCERHAQAMSAAYWLAPDEKSPLPRECTQCKMLGKTTAGTVYEATRKHQERPARKTSLPRPARSRAAAYKGPWRDF